MPAHTYYARNYASIIVPSTKDVIHHRRSKGKASATVTVLAYKTTPMKKEQFLANQKYKQQFIFMLSAELEKCNYKTFHAPADADSF